MLFSIPWYVVLFESIPEMFILIILGFKLFNIDVDMKKTLLVSTVSSILCYVIRKYVDTFGIHTIFTLMLAVILIKFIMNIGIVYSFICTMTSCLICGLFENLFICILFKIFNININYLTYYPWLNILFFLPIGILMLFMYFLIKKKKFYLFDFNFCSQNLVKISKNKSILFMLMTLSQGIFIMVVAQIYLLMKKYSMIEGYLIFINIIIILITILILISIRGLGEDIKNKVQTKMLKNHFSQIENLLNASRAKSHEYKRHIQAIQAMIYLRQVKAAEEYIEGLTETCVHMDDVVYVENVTLTALMNNKRKIAEVDDIRFDFFVNCKLDGLKIDGWELSSIFGNLLDNAFEATIKQKNNRKVTLSIDLIDNEYVITICNTGKRITEDEIKKLFEPGYTTKDSIGRGYGLYLIKNLIEKYGGSIKVECVEEIIFTITFPYQEGVEDDKQINN